MKVKPKKIMPQSVRDEILCFLANCGTKTKLILAILLFNALTELLQIILWLLMLIR